jgi:hypothetical protein
MLGDKQPNASSDKVGDRLIANPKEARVVASKILSKKRHVTARKKRSAGRSPNGSSSSASISTSTEVKKVKRNGCITPKTATEDNFNACGSVHFVASTEGSLHFGSCGLHV